MINNHTHGSHLAWDEVYQNLDLSYSEKANSQGKLFEIVKIGFLKEIFPKPPLKILEVGCGTAFVSLYFAKRGYSASCLDINKSVLNIAEKNFQKEGVKGKFNVGDAEKLPFADNQFDIVTSFGLLEHFENPQIAILEMVRVLKHGGLFFADIVPNRFSCQTMGNLFNAVAVLTYWLFNGKPALGFTKAVRNFRPAYFENSISWQEYKKVMIDAELNQIQVRGNRPFPRLTLPRFLDHIYTRILKTTVFAWKMFDRWNSFIPRTWGAGLWFWGYKSKG